MMTLRTQLQVALVEAFPTQDALDQLVQEAFHTNRARITTSSGLDAMVDDLLRYCEAQASVAWLLCVAYNRNPNNQLLSRLVVDADRWPELVAAGLVVIEGRAYVYAARDVELAYLEKLLQHPYPGIQQYTPLAGIAEVVEAPEEEPLPPEFYRLAEFGFGPERRVERVRVADVRDAVAEYRRLVILGEPGSGKSTTLQRLTVEYARAARVEPTAPLPLYVELGRYKGSEPMLDFVCNQVRALADQIPAYLHHGHAFLLLDALNEMPRGDYAARVQRVQELLTQFPKLSVVITCRQLDYVEALRLEKLEIQPLDMASIQAFSRHYLGPDAGETFFSQLVGESTLAAWRSWQQDGSDGNTFLQAVRSGQLDLPRSLRNVTVSPLLLLAGNPYLLRMLTVVSQRNQGTLPANRGKLFNAYTGLLWAREQTRHESSNWPGEEVLVSALAHLATQMQLSGERGTAVDKEWAMAQLTLLAVSSDQVLYLAASANLVDLANEQVRFVHQLVQEYFAALAMRTQLAQGADLATYWPQGWVNRSGWEETTILLAGLLDDMTPLVDRLLVANPPLAAQAIAESGVPPPAVQVIAQVQTMLVGLATGVEIPLAQRNAAGNALNILGDPRPGVGLTQDGLPDIVWCAVPGGKFTMGNTKQSDEMAWGNEAPQHQVYLDDFWIAKYPITNGQYVAFVGDGGYSERWHQCWTTAGWRWRTRSNVSDVRKRGGDFDWANHPVVGVSWYEALAFCNWLGAKLGRPVALPSEAQWEKAARGTDGRRYPWAGALTEDHANWSKTPIGTTSAVGLFPRGASPYDVLDMAGNVWEWTSSKFQKYRYDPADGREDPAGDDRRTLRGGSFADLEDLVRCAYRPDSDPYYRYVYEGFRVVVSSPGS